MLVSGSVKGKVPGLLFFRLGVEVLTSRKKHWWVDFLDRMILESLGRDYDICRKMTSQKTLTTRLTLEAESLALCCLVGGCLGEVMLLLLQ